MIFMIGTWLAQAGLTRGVSFHSFLPNAFRLRTPTALQVLPSHPI